MAPLMKSKKGDKICCGCDKNYAIEEKKKPVEDVIRKKQPEQPIKPPTMVKQIS